MKNEERYKTAQERQDAFKKFCDSHDCYSCHAQRKDMECILGWLELECEEEELKPCPFCGCKEINIRALKVPSENIIWIECDHCQAKTQINDKNHAILAWNRRV